jgi:hypothetical protein
MEFMLHNVTEKEADEEDIEEMVRYPYSLS